MKTYLDGLRDAAQLLADTAADYEQGFERRVKEIESASLLRQLGLEGLKISLRVDREKAQLLRGQAMRVLEIGPTADIHSWVEPVDPLPPVPRQ